ncbi:50S ribosomal protein L21 [candidate division KSB1 bacterium]|nr:50S ribosomal protein L21 [candidate division KSB1 bacterium]RQV99800.1 MAG: 50S ribosomal protein L21 [candidate division KSB1 bacterium]
MYAIVDIAGQQFKVKKDDVVLANRIVGEAGADVEFDKVVLLSDEEGARVGTPYIDGAKVTATIVGHEKGDKVLVFKKKRRKGYRVLNGHRQPLTRLEIKDIVA